MITSFNCLLTSKKLRSASIFLKLESSGKEEAGL